MAIVENHVQWLSVCEPPEPVEGNLFVSAYPPFSCWQADCSSEFERVLQSSPDKRGDAPLGLYVHIPFCLQRCQFCYYRSIANPASDTIDSYLDALIHEIRLYGESPRLKGRKLAFVYFGGGTPALLSPGQMQRLFRELQSVFPWCDIQEVTFECSPKTVTRDRLETLHAAGVTRISMGAQQLNDDVLRQSGRIHLVDDIRRAYDEIRQHHFDVVNIDLMVGLVGETEQSFFESLHQVISMNPDSITFYQLEIPANTPLFHALHEGQISSLAGWDMKRQRLTDAFAQLESEGYTLRSAYAAVRDPARHRFHYQEMQYRGADLLGTGLASFGYLGGMHYQNQASMREYSESLAAGRLPYKRGYVLDDEERMVREFVLQLKLGRVETQYFSSKFGVNVAEHFREQLRRFANRGWLSPDAGAVTLTRQGLLRVDRLLPAFYRSEHRDLSYW
ncbi:MAG: coproporphyrinogen III oxidase family protein [Planctomycetales bacterium]|nr:coproporphyrinogen III oxidase family protein [Planctomycetales bacterium]